MIDLDRLLAGHNFIVFGQSLDGGCRRAWNEHRWERSEFSAQIHRICDWIFSVDARECVGLKETRRNQTHWPWFRLSLHRLSVRTQTHLHLQHNAPSHRIVRERLCLALISHRSTECSMCMCVRARACVCACIQATKTGFLGRFSLSFAFRRCNVRRIRQKQPIFFERFRLFSRLLAQHSVCVLLFTQSLDPLLLTAKFQHLIFHFVSQNFRRFDSLVSHIQHQDLACFVAAAAVYDSQTHCVWMKCLATLGCNLDAERKAKKKLETLKCLATLTKGLAKSDAWQHLLHDLRRWLWLHVLNAYQSEFLVVRHKSLIFLRFHAKHK